MHLKCRIRRKDGKLHHTYSIVESRRHGRRVSHKHILYLGEITDSQRHSWVSDRSGAYRRGIDGNQ